MELTEEEVQLFELAFLLRMPVYKLVQEMPYEEMLGWFAYFKLRPPGWREDYRASVISQSMGAKMDASKVFPALAALKREAAPDKGLKTSAFFMAMMNATEGRLPFMEAENAENATKQ